MSRPDLPSESEVARQLVASNFAPDCLRTSIGDVAFESVGDIERLLRWADSVLDCATPRTALLPVADKNLEPAVLWFYARLFERMEEPERVLELLCGSRLATSSQEMEAFRLLSVARAHHSLGSCTSSALALRRAINLTENPALLRKAANLAGRILQTGDVRFDTKCRLALLGDVTFTNYVSPLKAFAFAKQIDLTLHIGAYGQHFQELQSPASALAAFKPTVVVLALTWHSLGLAQEEADPDRVVRRAVDACQELWALALRQGAALVIQHNFEIPETSAYGHLSMALPRGQGRILRRINLELERAADEAGRVAILDVDHLSASIGKGVWTDDRMWAAAKHYPSAAATPRLARHQVALVRAMHGAPSKCLVLDLDGTLWGGVIGEDGLAGIRLGGSGEGEAFAEFQRYAKALAQRGVLLAVCSKNDEPLAKSAFLEHQEMVLKLEDISAFYANWRPKYENLQLMARELNLGLDSLVLVDDDPAERMSVRAMLPEVEVPEVGSDPSQFGTILSRSLVFEALSITREDRERTESYVASTARRELEEKSLSLDDYLSALGMRLSLTPVDELSLPRAVQLIGKTNQFNLLTSRMNEADVRGYLGADGYARLARLSDNYGDYGITGLMLAKASGEVLCIDEWLLSCRILSRRVEEAMFAAVWNFAYRSGFNLLRAQYRKTSRNQQVEDLYDRLGMRLDAKTADLKSYSAVVDSLREMPNCFSSIQLSEDSGRAAVVGTTNH